MIFKRIINFMFPFCVLCGFVPQRITVLMLVNGRLHTVVMSFFQDSCMFPNELNCDNINFLKGVFHTKVKYN